MLQTLQKIRLIRRAALLTAIPTELPTVSSVKVPADCFHGEAVVMGRTPQPAKKNWTGTWPASGSILRRGSPVWESPEEARLRFDQCSNCAIGGTQSGAGSCSLQDRSTTFRQPESNKASAMTVCGSQPSRTIREIR